MPDKRLRPRWLQKLRARWGHYFWMACPICGEPFGGHEPGGQLQISAIKTRTVCANCVEEADRRSAEMFNHWDQPEYEVRPGGEISVPIGTLAPGEGARLAIVVHPPEDRRE